MTAARWLLTIALAALWLMAAAPGRAALPSQGFDCFAVTSHVRPPGADVYSCEGTPSGYQDRWLWLQRGVDPALGGNRPMLVMRSTRFEHLSVHFRYSDGVTKRYDVGAGDYGRHWRLGGRLIFTPPERDAPLVSVTLGFRELAASELLRAHLLPLDQAISRLFGAVALIGASLALLVVSFCYNLSLGVGAGRVFAFWHALWALCVFGWGAFWTQLVLYAFPQAAGGTSVILSGMLATLAIGCAGASLITALEPGMASRRAKILAGIATALVPIIAVVTLTVPTVYLMSFARMLNISVLLAGGMALFLVVQAWRRGSRAARDYALCWTLPVTGVLLTQVTDIGLGPRDDGGQLMVLSFSALQMLVLSLAGGRRLAGLRRERDVAQRRQAELLELAHRDPMTGLLNRRGFVGHVSRLLEAPEAGAIGYGFLLIDIDHFKAINDRYGHHAGDKVLERMGTMLNALPPSAVTGRLGGEEFGILVEGCIGAELLDFANRVRRDVRALDLSNLLAGTSAVTVSIGAVDNRTLAEPNFEQMYRQADLGLYLAKASGRDQVKLASEINGVALQAAQ